MEQEKRVTGRTEEKSEEKTPLSLHSQKRKPDKIRTLCSFSEQFFSCFIACGRMAENEATLKSLDEKVQKLQAAVCCCFFHFSARRSFFPLF